MQCKIQVKKICEMRKSRGDERCNAGKARSFRVLQCNEERKNKKQGMEDMQQRRWDRTRIEGMLIGIID
jgi:hypothetical protein